jgi:hypothetical protein
VLCSEILKNREGRKQGKMKQDKRRPRFEGYSGRSLILSQPHLIFLLCLLVELFIHVSLKEEGIFGLGKNVVRNVAENKEL